MPNMLKVITFWHCMIGLPDGPISPEACWPRLSAFITGSAAAAVSGHGDPFQGRHLASAGRPGIAFDPFTPFNLVRHDEFQSAAVDDVHHDRLRG
ncbi:hypothetical protein F01_550058 [Burkholderia cenocepacia]|nr:hypothetical protein F01_550058 [Burkholderia cenocepacia]